ncbi:hypothetical protein CRM22_006552 [Opisthorchis felineus]|uniref:Uncharacterized protein n=1 Tax=Opisthorchis felineus TaxID=147828 RepID=A0A4S2LKC4_OPIFE|nr:hypothetical protein CRM22_006552 [Opisthorchis felineus]
MLTEACGKDPNEDDISAVTQVDECRDKCNIEERDRCLEKHKDNEEQKRKCYNDALDRCAVRCGDDAECLLKCLQLHIPPEP